MTSSLRPAAVEYESSTSTASTSTRGGDVPTDDGVYVRNYRNYRQRQNDDSRVQSAQVLLPRKNFTFSPPTMQYVELQEEGLYPQQQQQQQQRRQQHFVELTPIVTASTTPPCVDTTVNHHRDDIGAGYYVIVVILVYGMSVVALIASSMKKKHTKLLEDRQINNYLKEFQVVHEKSSRDTYRNLKRSVILELSNIATRGQAVASIDCDFPAAAAAFAAVEFDAAVTGIRAPAVATVAGSAGLVTSTPSECGSSTLSGKSIQHCLGRAMLPLTAPLGLMTVKNNSKHPTANELKGSQPIASNNVGVGGSRLERRRSALHAIVDMSPEDSPSKDRLLPNCPVNNTVTAFRAAAAAAAVVDGTYRTVVTSMEDEVCPPLSPAPSSVCPSCRSFLMTPDVGEQPDDNEDDIIDSGNQLSMPICLAQQQRHCLQQQQQTESTLKSPQRTPIRRLELPPSPAHRHHGSQPLQLSRSSLLTAELPLPQRHTANRSSKSTDSDSHCHVTVPKNEVGQIQPNTSTQAMTSSSECATINPTAELSNYSNSKAIHVTCL